jgi:segregation and condensation protein B
VEQQLKNIIEAALFSAGEPLTVDRLQGLFDEGSQPGKKEIREALNVLRDEFEGRGIELAEVSSGFRFQARQEHSQWVARLWDEKPPRYSRALLETLALVAYRQPITRAEIEDIRGVSVSSSIMKTLQERDWVRVVGHRDVPGKPGLYATTREFLDYFNLKGLDDLPSLAELKDIDKLNAELDLRFPGEEGASNDEDAAALEEQLSESDATPESTLPEGEVENGIPEINPPAESIEALDEGDVLN